MNNVYDNLYASIPSSVHISSSDGTYNILENIQIRSQYIIPWAVQHILTGNYIIDITIVFISIILLLQIPHVIWLIKESLTTVSIRLLESLIPWKRYKLTGLLKFETDYAAYEDQESSSIPLSVRAINYKLCNLPKANIWHIEAKYIQNYQSTQDVGIEKSEESVFQIVQSDPINVGDNIYVTFQKEEKQPEQQKIDEQAYSNNQYHSKAEDGIPVCQKVYIKNTIKVYSYKHDVHYLKKVVENWIDEYHNNIKHKFHGRQLIFSVRFCLDKYGQGIKDVIRYSDFQTYRSFKNLFFDEKHQVLNDIDFFINNKEWHYKRGITDSLGILCYGKPGCGKTSFIKALLKRTQRHAVIFSVNKYTGLQRIEDIMTKNILCDIPIKQSERIYVIEDVDAMGDLVKKRKGIFDLEGRRAKKFHYTAYEPSPLIWKEKNVDTVNKGYDDDLSSDVISESSSNNDSSSSNHSFNEHNKDKNDNYNDDEEDGNQSHTTTMLESSIMIDKKQKRSSRSADHFQVNIEKQVEEEVRKRAFFKWLKYDLQASEQHLGFFLNLLDGIVETDGRIIIFTTNHPEKLDPALLRPGRIDILLHFKRCSRTSVAEILSHFYNVPIVMCTDPEVIIYRGEFKCDDTKANMDDNGDISNTDKVHRLSEPIVLPSYVQDGCITPAELINCCRQYKFDIHKVLEELKNFY